MVPSPWGVQVLSVSRFVRIRCQSGDRLRNECGSSRPRLREVTSHCTGNEQAPPSSGPMTKTSCSGGETGDCACAGVEARPSNATVQSEVTAAVEARHLLRFRREVWLNVCICLSSRRGGWLPLHQHIARRLARGLSVSPTHLILRAAGWARHAVCCFAVTRAVVAC